MLGKLFRSKKTPTDVGDEGLKAEGLRTVKLFELELSNMENTPTYAITHQITIGSEVGNIVVSDPSISPRHAAFILQDEVISVMDHGSVSGTKINGKKIPSGRYIILEETDVIGIGDLEIKIKVKTEVAPQEAIPEIPGEPAPVVKTQVPGEGESLPEEVPVEQATRQPPKGVPKPKVVPKKKKKWVPTDAANSLVRIIAVLSDLLIAYSIIVVFSPFDEFRQFLEKIPQELNALLGLDWGTILQDLTQGHGFIGDMINDLLPFLAGLWNVGPVLIVFILFRLLSTLIFGVSLSELVVGMRGGGHFLWARLGGMIRVVLGMVTGPFLLFDFPAIISKRTFKEFLTFTRVYSSSKLMAFFGALFYLPFLAALALVSPLFQGLEVSAPVHVNTNLDRRIKAQVAPVEGEENREVQQASQFLHVEMRYALADVTLMPLFNFKGVQTKLNFQPELSFYLKELQRPVSLEIVKTFDLRQLIGLGMKGNFFLYDKFPELYTFVYEAGGNPSFKVRADDKAQVFFANDFMSFTQMALGLNAANVADVMQSNTPLIKGLMDFKASLLALLEHRDFDEIGFIKIGNTIFMKVSYQKQRPFDLIIPLVKGQGRMFKVSYDSKEKISAISSKFYKFILENTNWIHPSFSETSAAEVMTPFKVIDLFAGIGPKNKNISPENGQALYGFYYERSAEILKGADTTEQELWKKSVFSTYKVIEALSVQNEGLAENAGENPVRKLFENFRDLNDAVENKNLEYFGISPATSI